jgi:uncharacterized protein (DUF1778 family)
MTDTLTGRLNFRLAPEQERALRAAAALSGQSVSGFVLSAATEQANELLERANSVEISHQHFREFLAALDAPATVVPELSRLFNRESQIPNQ